MASYEYHGIPITASMKKLLDELEAEGGELFRKLGVAEDDKDDGSALSAALIDQMEPEDLTDPRVQQLIMKVAAKMAKSSTGRQKLALAASSWLRLLDHEERESEQEDQAGVANEYKQLSEKQKHPDIPATDANGIPSPDNKCQSQQPDKSGGRGSKKRGKDAVNVGEASKSSTIDEPVHDWGRNAQ